MNKIFIDSINWLEYLKDDSGNLWLVDYPNSEMHGGGPPRKRMLFGNQIILSDFEKLLVVLEQNSNHLHENHEITKQHLKAIGNVAESFTTSESKKESISTAARAFGWSYLPEYWGKNVESAWAIFTETAKNKT
ncbi:Imm27 family immunity protein [Cellvibrio sp. QJXJ]|uniref:Imm27 family immunity protein n=1 Tax=Cellvibrio sp. QJXJ TaxID=2964606 RepID=UPI0021C2BDB0|nr:Imm27 family immunity protein [Cellvibrio sp. QJXJ]UUA72350.1 Imm27 family immunity protein [Cellvibrio sp. QJXJ]